MKSLGKADDGDVIASLNVIPFVDIVLVLLVIFMLTSATIMRGGIEVKLPKSASAGSAVKGTINLELTLDGRLRVDGEERTVDQARERIRREAAADPKAQVVISTDRAVPYGRLVELIDLVRTNGLTTFALDLERVGPGAVAPMTAPPTTPTP